MINEIYAAYKEVDINDEWLYHWIIDEKMLYSVYEYGILSKENLRKNKIDFLRDNPENIGCNGKDYVSVCKKMNNYSYAYNRFIKNNMAFIIDSNIDCINSIEERVEVKRNILLKKIIGPKIMTTEKIIVNSRDEYLVKDIVPFQSIIGFKLPFLYNEKDILMLIEFLIDNNLNLPIIDVDRKCKLEQNKVLKLLKH